ncbi:MAG: hypothetical protein B7Z31_07780 [Rhodobacterales bacterium 12-65-15]|nr:MAG: hypothetical protein B7Z31_07780 [Rhodobacterales bacterium 12-65-15]
MENMKKILLGTTMLVLTTAASHAGGIDRADLSYAILFEEGNYAEIGFSRVRPEVSGAYPLGLGGGSTGDMAVDYSTYALSYKHQFSDRLHFGLFINTPYGADANYTQGAYNGLNATWDSEQIAGVLRYEVTPAVSIYGGLRYLRSKAEINIPGALLPGTYSARGSTEDFGYIVGAAYEKPEIALRVALTYEGEIEHNFPTTEVGPAIGGTQNTTTDIIMPQSLALDFQTGIAKDTLLFGQIRWSEWSAWEVRPPAYEGLTGDSVTDFDDDVFTYQLGIGRRLNDNWSVFARAGYEKSDGGVSSRLSPTDGYKSFGIGGTYTQDNLKVTAGLEYVKLGDAIDGSGVVFEGSEAVGFGMTVGFRF